MIPLVRILRAAVGSDRDLLDRYVRERDESAFEALVRRHGAAVWAACVRLAGRDAEDAFQTVLVILSRKASTISGSLPAWLHSVTRRVASNIRRDARRRSASESAAARSGTAASGGEVGLGEALEIFDEELSRLPEKYRAVLLVCCLEGHSRDEAAHHLGWSEGQVKGRLERARELLRSRLIRRGLELGGLLLLATNCGPAPARIPPTPAIQSLAQGVMSDMVKHKQRLAAAVLALGVLGAGILLANGPDAKDQPRPAEKTVEPQPISWEFVGHAQATASLEVRSQVTGTLTRVAVREGDAVKKGDLLAEIDPRAHRLALDAAKARLMGAQARLQVAKLTADNTKRLHKNNVVSAEEVALHVAKEAEAEAAAAVAKVEVEQAELTLSWTRIAAPFEGRVSRIHIGEGGLVTSEQTHILTVLATDRLYLSFQVPEATLLQMRRDGMTEADKLGVAFGLSGETGHPHAAKLDAIDPEIDPRTGTARFRAVAPNPKGLLSPGMSARIRLTVAGK